MVPMAVGVTTRRRVAPAPTAREPRLHVTPLALCVKVPCESVALKKVAFEENKLASATCVAARLPRFVRARLKVTNSPSEAGAGLTLAESVRSGRCAAKV